MIVHPEPASESSDSVAELVADTTRSGDRAARYGEWQNVVTGVLRDGGGMLHPVARNLAYEIVGYLLPVADAEVAAAVAAVRADLADQIEAAPLAYDEPWSACEPYVLAIVKGPSS